ncbi:MAG TPA: hypothetical protein VEB65_05150 [Solirubrobacterales bacterium]|nr:hypothetical protein [Solirubrobacterales bacterium]
MPDWPPIEERELQARLELGDAEFRQMVTEIARAIPPREFDAAALAFAVGYPWARPPGSYELRDGEVALLAELPEGEREALIERYRRPAAGRVPLLAIGSNAAPAALERKFAHFEAAEDRAVLALTGWLRDFDVGPSASVTIYGSLPATIFPSPGTEVAATILWVTAPQFTQLTWSELSYWLGRLHTPFAVAEAEAHFDDVLVYVSRFGTFCPEDEPVALAAVPARGRTALALSQEELLGVAATLALGPGSSAEDLVRACCEGMGGLVERLAERVWSRARPFESPDWTPYPSPDRAPSDGGPG